MFHVPPGSDVDPKGWSTICFYHVSTHNSQTILPIDEPFESHSEVFLSTGLTMVMMTWIFSGSWQCLKVTRTHLEVILHRLVSQTRCIRCSSTTLPVIEKTFGCFRGNINFHMKIFSWISINALMELWTTIHKFLCSTTASITEKTTCFYSYKTKK